MPAITVDNLSKSYRIGLKEEIPDTLVGALSSWAKAPLRNFRRLRRLNTFQRSEVRDQRSEEDSAEADTIWALKDVSFAVEEGEVVGVIGRNGAGKSTLLKILSRITEPTGGRAVIRGRVSSLLEVGTGFHPELTGRENVYMNGTILGMSKREIDRKFDEIVAFSGVERFLDTPVKRYSSGMKVRLAFAVAAHLEPEILIVDEVLAVGDAEFQRKCLGKMQDVASGGRTVVFVSHNMSAVQQLCTRGLVLRHGAVTFVGQIMPAVRHYLHYLESGASLPLEENPTRRGTGEVRLTAIRLRNASGQITENLVAGESASFEFEYTLGKCATNIRFAFTLFNEAGAACTHIHTGLHDVRLDSSQPRGVLICALPRVPFPVGGYRLSVVIDSNGLQADRILGCFRFQVVSSVFFPSPHTPDVNYCPVMVDHSWRGPGVVHQEPTPLLHRSRRIAPTTGYARTDETRTLTHEEDACPSS